MTDQSSSHVHVELGSNGGQVVFIEPADVENWLTAEKTYWAWLMQARKSDPSTLDVHGHFNTSWNRIQKHSNRWRDGNSEAERDAAKGDLAIELRVRYGDTRQALHSTSPDAKFLDALRAINPVLALYAAPWFVTNLVPTVSTPKAIEAAIEVQQFRKGFSGSVASERAALEHLKHQWQDEWNQAKIVSAHHSSNIQRLAEDIGRVASQQATSFDETMSKHKAELADQFAFAKDELAKVAKTYDQFMALKAPVKYWESRRTRSFAVAGASMVLFLVSAAIALAFAKVLLSGLSNGTAIDWSHLGYVLFSFTLIFWWTRILIRIFLSNFHLATDAAERAVLIQTYLAMIREEKAVGEGSRDSMLAAVFRPSASGLVKDDALPHVFYDWLTRIKQ